MPTRRAPADTPRSRTWGKDADGNLVGTLEMPMAVGIVGGATKVHPAAQAALKLMGVKTADELAEIIVSVGLAQNLAALRALATEGIQRGHMCAARPPGRHCRRRDRRADRKSRRPRWSRKRWCASTAPRKS